MCAFRRIVLLSILLASVGSIFAQTTSGTITGFVEDPSHAAVRGATVTLTDEHTNVQISTTSRDAGDFVLPGIQPGLYTVTVSAAGFKELQKVHITLDANHNVSTGRLILEPGGSTETVTVSGEGTPIQSTSSERSAVLDNTQIENLLSAGRDAMSFLRTMPGTVGGSNASTLGTQVTPTINGLRNESNNISVDGVTGNVSGNQNFYSALNLDAIQEISVLQGNYQAEYGKTNGAGINIVSKSGTRNYHGTLYYYNRNEALNANSYFAKRAGQSRARYRYNTSGGTIGGPVYWPGRFNSGRNKLFFFISVEDDPNSTPEGLKYFRVPTALERSGDFSQTYNQGTVTQTASTLIRIKDPSSSAACAVNSATPGPGCFLNNKIPNGQIPASQLALMSIFPLPNYSNLALSNNNYNYITNTAAETPVNQEVVRIDYAATEKLHLFVKWQTTTTNDNGYNSPTAPAPWIFKVNYQTKSPSLAANAIYAFSPTLLNEFNFGRSGWDETQLYTQSDLAKLQLNSSGYNIGGINAANNPFSLLPSISFGGISNAAGISWNTRFPMVDVIQLYSVTDNLTKVIGRHTTKFGADFETSHYLQTERGGMGTFAWARNISNPYDSNYAYSNALLGNFSTYTEPTQLKNYNPKTPIFEWYAQDKWQATHHLTFDYGMRFTWAIPQQLQYGANFVPSLFVPGNAPALYQPTASKTAKDPTSGISTYPAAYVGLYVPNTGNTANGMLPVGTPGYPQGSYYGNGVLYAPRVGFAYDPVGDNKTVIRGGYGIFYNARAQAGTEGGLYANPPVIYKPTQYYGNVSSFQNAAGLLGPSSIGSSVDLHPKQASSMNMTLGVQRTLFSGTTLDVAYVGTFGRHLADFKNINEVPYGAEFQQSNQSVAGGTLSDNFFRPYPGYQTINLTYFDLTSNYNSLQVKLERRYRRSLGFGVAYTYSKALDFADTTSTQMPTYQDRFFWQYGPAGFDYRHNLVANYVWSLPRGSALWSNVMTRAVLDNWQISGIASHLSGAPNAIGLTVSNGANITGGGDGARVVLNGDPNRNAPHTFNQWFNTSVVQVPLAGKAATSTSAAVSGQTGNERKVSFRNPGVTNFDTALFKNFPIKGRFAAQFRLETYNTFNHSEFNAVNTTAVFANASNSTTPQTSTIFGQLSGTANPRYLQLAMRINF